MKPKASAVSLLKENSFRMETLSRVLKDIVLYGDNKSLKLKNNDLSVKARVLQGKLLDICIDNEKLIEEIESELNRK